jgi:hypothetical protein
VAAIIAAACAGAQERANAKEGPVSDVAAILDRLDGHADAAIEITTGVEHFRKGLVVLSVGGDGRFVIVNRRAGNETRQDGKLDAAALREFAADVAAGGIARLEARPGPRQPGDSPVVIKVLKDGRVVLEKRLWDADRWEDKGLERVLARYDQVVSNATGGQLPY